MKRLTSLLALCFLIPFSGISQKRVLSYPFAFERSLLSREDYDAFFLDNRVDSTIAIVLKDNKKAEYALLDKKFKVTAKIPSNLKSTLFGDGIDNYTGGTTSGRQFHFIYKDEKGSGKTAEEKEFSRQIRELNVFTHQVGNLADKLFSSPKGELLFKILKMFA